MVAAGSQAPLSPLGVSREADEEDEGRVRESDHEVLPRVEW
jgi:hypothetical protein